jgi:mannose-6-phosphate isomerase class I
MNNFASLGRISFISCDRIGFLIQLLRKVNQNGRIAKPGSFVFEPPGDIHTLITGRTKECKSEKRRKYYFIWDVEL